MKTLTILATACLIALGEGCATQVRHQLRNEAEAQVTISAAVRAWEVVEAGRVVGVLVEFEERGGERRFFSARNPEQQELGMIDEQGRAWRYRPHASEPEWLGTGTVSEGVRRILELGTGAELLEVTLEVLSAKGS